MDTLLLDLRYALRSLRRSRGFAAAATLCLALGIGVNTATFSIVNTVLLRPPPFADGDRVVRLYSQAPRQEWEQDAFSTGELAEIRARSRTLAGVAGAGQRGFNLAGGGEAVRLQGSPVTHDLFPLLGVRPALGRGFLPEEDRPGGEPVVILGHEVWRSQFGGRADVVGSKAVVNGIPTTVVGVMPRGFRFPVKSDLWVPARPDPADALDARWSWMVAVARLRPGATTEQAGADLARVARELAAEHPATHAGWRFGARAYGSAYVRGERGTMLALMLGAVGFVLLIACANVANMLLARGAARRREIAVRAALGAARRRIVRQLLTESVLIALSGGAAGVLVGTWWLDWLVSTLGVEVPYWMTFELDGRVLAYTAALSVATGLLFGVLPALRASRPDLTGALGDGAAGATGGPRRNRLRGTLVAGEIALALVLLAGSALSIRSFLAAARTDPGVDAGRILTARTSLTGERYDAVAARAAFFRQLEGRIGALPGVRGAALTTALPAGDEGAGTTVAAEGAADPDDEIGARWIAVTPGYWEAMGRPLLAGRNFTEREAADSAARVAIVSAELAERLWPGRDPLGRRIRVEVEGATPWLTVVGVAPTLGYAKPGEDGERERRQVHLPYARAGWRLMTLAVRSAGDPAALAAPVRREVRALDPSLPLFTVHTMSDYRASTLWLERAAGQAFASLALLALLLAALGVYGVTAYAVGQRTREIGIRMALGARAPDVVGMVVREGALLAAAGIGVGLLGAWGVSRLMRSTLYGVGPGDPVAFVAAPLLLAAVAVAASWLPARRAARVDPMTALRSE